MPFMPNNVINIEVVYAQKDHYKIIALAVAPGSSIEQAIVQSQILTEFPHIDLYANEAHLRNCVGVFNQIKQLGDEVRAGDRVEIYRPLPQSAIEARKARAKAQRKAKLQKRASRRG
jgi:putative ubiquitin-RnfH superfamily antitoxin RatB of RatAB toxin-antitoxin module